MLRDKQGNKLYRSVKVKIIFPDNILPDKVMIQHAGPKQGFGSEAIDDILMQVADMLESSFPFWEFKAQEMTPEHRTARYLITFAGYRAVPAPTTIDGERNTPTTESAADLVHRELSPLLETPIVVPPIQDEGL